MALSEHLRRKCKEHIEAELLRLTEHTAKALEISAKHYERRYPPTINDTTETNVTSAVARQVAGDESVYLDLDPMMGAEDLPSC